VSPDASSFDSGLADGDTWNAQRQANDGVTNFLANLHRAADVMDLTEL
jgi:hypothetical protein